VHAELIGEFWSYPQSRTFAEPLIDCAEDRTLREAASGNFSTSSSTVSRHPSRGFDH
jgi:hypothetical protein